TCHRWLQNGPIWQYSGERSAVDWRRRTPERKQIMPSVRNFTLAAVLLAGLGLALPALSAPEGGFGHGLMGWQKIHDQLNVTTSQQVLWDAAVAASKSAHDTVRQNHQQLHQAVQAEPAKDPPDLP